MDFDTPVDRRGTASVKWNKYENRDVIPLWVADMDFRSPPAVMEALHRRVDHGVFGYSAAPRELVEEVLSHLAGSYGWTVEPEWVVWLPGLVTGLNVTCRAAGEDGDGVIAAVPVYPPFLSAPRNSRRALTTVPLVESREGWVFDLEELDRAITPSTRLLLLCNPHNPVGRAFHRAELEALAEICARRDLVVCSDEIHCELLLDPDAAHVPIATLGREVGARTITLMAPSKTYNLPGLGCSFAVVPDKELRARVRGAMAGIVPHVNALGYTAALAAYRDGREWLEELIRYLRGNRDLVVAELGARQGLRVSRVEATYLAWIDVRPLGLDDPVRFFEEAGVGLSDGRDFGGPGFVRLNFGCPRSVLQEALRRMCRAVGQLCPRPKTCD